MYGASDKGDYTSACVPGVAIFVECFVDFNLSSILVFEVCFL